ncbi:MAG: twin-arginine translocation signal domain-containing protein, partial [Petrimonas mucosa]
MKRENNLTRRGFLKTSAVAGAAGMIGTGTTGFLSSCSSGKKDATTPLKEPGS